MNRREFLKGASLGIGAGALGAMGLYSYTPMRRAFLPKVERQMSDFGVCKSVKVTTLDRVFWFDNGISCRTSPARAVCSWISTPTTGPRSATARA